MSLVYLVLMVAVSAVLMFAMADAVLSASRRPAWQTAQARLAAEGASVQYLPRATPVVARPVPVEAAAVDEEAAHAA